MSLEHIIRRKLIGFVWKAKGLNIERMYRDMMSREFWDKTQWEAYQQEQIKQLVEHCYKNVPYYRKTFDELKIKPEEITSIETFKKIPILNKAIVREQGDELLAENIDKESLRKVHTTGSTGSPLAFYGGQRRREFLTAGLWRIYSRCGWKPGERIGSIWGFKEKEMNEPQWKRSFRDYFNGISRFNAWKANEEDFRFWYKKMKKQKVTIIVCYASTGSRFAQWLLDNNLTLKRIKGVYCTSEKLYDEQKQIINKALNCPVYNLYGCGEVNHVACTCEEGNMHINPDTVVVETGQPDEIGQTPLLLTGFANYAMPFLRYTNGDAGSLDDAQCKCGRKSPIMKLNITRLADIFTFADGKKYPSLYFVLRLYKSGFEGVELFQFHQDKINHIFLKIVKNKKFNQETQNNLEKAVHEIENHINSQAKVELVYTDYIEQSATSKHYYAKSDVR